MVVDSVVEKTEKDQSEPYLVVDLGHSGRGRFKQIQISPKTLYWSISGFVVFLLIAFVFVTSYLQMFWKVSHYNELRSSFDHLRSRYQSLQKEAKQQNQQMASLQNLATEVSVAYGLNQPSSTHAVRDLSNDAPLSPTIHDSMEQFTFLASANLADTYHKFPYRWQQNAVPSIWPLNGLLRSPFGARLDPFSGEGAFHTGMDVSATVGTPVHVTADGVVERTAWTGRYGKLVIIAHPNGMKTYYAHLSQYMVMPGQEVRRGQTVALSGGTGRVSGPHLHYEVRIGTTPVNPYKYMGRPPATLAADTTHSHNNDFGL